MTEKAQDTQRKETVAKAEKAAEPAADKPKPDKKPMPSAEDLQRYEKYVGQKWEGKCRWFNVMKGFGFIDPYFPEAQEHGDDVFVHQVGLRAVVGRAPDLTPL